ncbi:MAG: carboxypeptidase regulatory-like domain-containing protein [Thermomicrobiales bacterium]|nr:MAG: carboxypeptidase regulatory-like domain-containing protein [Thermomicrobiales bacterium]
MLIGYVSDENYVAQSDVAIEIDRDGELIEVLRSTPRGGVYADLEPGRYRFSLVKPGFGSKSVVLDLPLAEPYQFRLLSDCLLGYVWPNWVKTGERSEFRVHSHEPYRLTLWRYGLEKTFIAKLGWFDEHGPRAVMQITPDGDYVQIGVRWNKTGYGNPHLTQFVTGPVRSDRSYLEAKSNTGRFFSFPWIVSPAEPANPIAVILSTNTWNAYNNFGGRSNYVNSAGMPPTPAVNARQDMLRYSSIDTFGEWSFPDDAYPPVHFERPNPANSIPEGTQVTDPIVGRQGCHLAPAEWRLLGWLEREGFGYDVYSDHQLHAGELDLSAYDAAIASVHPEYWSREQFRRIDEWVKNDGGNFLYLGGNGLNCEVDFLDHGSALKFYNFMPTSGGDMGYIDPDTGVYIESRMHRRYKSEAELLGVVTTESGIMTAAPYRAADTSHWIYDGTGLQDGDIFGRNGLQERCWGGASGHETDKMSGSSPAEARLLAKGLNPDDGGGEIVQYDTASGGSVFSVGSITWPASLLVDELTSQITKNVLNRALK